MKQRVQFFLLFFAITIGLACCSKQHSTPPDVTTGLVTKILLNGDATDEVSGLTGNIFNATATYNRHNQPTRAMYFNRADSAYIDFGNLVNTSLTGQQFTICCWVKIMDTVSPSAVISKRNAFGPFEYSIDNHFVKSAICFDNWLADGSTTIYGIDPLNAYALVQLNKWVHIAFVGNSENVKAYCNGQLQAGLDMKKVGYTFVNSGAHFVIGNGGGYNKNYFFNGGIDDIYIYNIALTDEQIIYLSQL